MIPLKYEAPPQTYMAGSFQKEILPLQLLPLSALHASATGSLSPDWGNFPQIRKQNLMPYYIEILGVISPKDLTCSSPSKMKREFLLFCLMSTVILFQYVRPWNEYYRLSHCTKKEVK